LFHADALVRRFLSNLAPLSTWPNAAVVLRSVKELCVPRTALPVPVEIERVTIVDETAASLSPVGEADEEDDKDSVRIQQWLLDEIEQVSFFASL
jgi:hypothetical protein